MYSTVDKNVGENSRKKRVYIGKDDYNVSMIKYSLR